MNPHKDFFNKQAGNWDDIQSDADMKKIRSVLKKQNIKKGGKILDVGCGTGVLLPVLEELAGSGAVIYALDFSEKMIEKAREKYAGRFSYILCDAEDIKLESSCFDLAVCYSCFPHFTDKPKALGEIFRVLKPGGQLIIAHSKSREEINRFHENVGGPVKDHKIPPADKMRELLKNAGFSEVKIKESRNSYQAGGRKTEA